MTSQILLVDDEPAIRFSFSKYLTKKGFVVVEACNLADARAASAAQRFDAILLDLSLPDGNGLDWINEVREIRPDVAIVVITGVGDIPSAVEAMRRGADHFLAKPVNLGDLEVFLRKSLELGTLRTRHLAHRRLAKSAEPFFGQSALIQKTISLLKLAEKNESTVLLHGETGTGKGVFARWLHSRSSRSHMPFVEVNCSSLRGELLSSELFGHARGAFTSAVDTRQGLLDVAHGGTLFLDEIGDMDLGVQSQFLNVLEGKRYRRLGEVRERSSDFRLVCATNRTLLDDVHAGRFRKDLYFRINVLSIETPPLRNRLEDLHGIIRHLLDTLGKPNAQLTGEALALLHAYSWPGNLRELRNVLERATLLSGGEDSLTEAHFPGLESPQVLTNAPAYLNRNILPDEIAKALGRFHGDKKKAAESLGISRATLYRKLKEAEKR
ncbi:MAG TPA: sigma-54 dependent transcriptional regulator [Acidobacteriota bacterium]